MNKDFIIVEDLKDLGSETTKDYTLHALCLFGKATFMYNGEPMELCPGDLFIVREQHFVSQLTTSNDFKIKGIYISCNFIERNTTDMNFGIRSVLILAVNPVLKLNKLDQWRCKSDLENLEHRIGFNGHKFREDVLSTACLAFFLDIFNFETNIYGNNEVSNQNSNIITDFIALLHEGHYREHRDIGFYADKLCITAKHLSEVCRQVTGHPANFWINHFAKIEIKRKLRYSRLSVVQIAELFSFSSPAHFTRYVQTQLGASPKAIREL
jgi:AraC-like DNA-binding protein